jgi:hypothetical protein
MLATALAPGCVADDGTSTLDGGGDAAGACAIPSVPGVEDYLAEVVGELALGPRATAAQRGSARSSLLVAMGRLDVEAEHQLYSTGGNVVGWLPATTTSRSIVVVGAHLDTVAGSPGANDNATGVATVLAVARNLAAQRCRGAVVMFVAFDQEEVGLVGSSEFADRLPALHQEVLAVHTIDQVGWDRDGDRRFEIELPTETLWAEYQAAAAAIGVAVSRTDTGDTDHVSFRARGYPAAGVTEEFVGGDTSPYYHTAGDTIATVELAYTARAVELITTVVGRELGGER